MFIAKNNTRGGLVAGLAEKEESLCALKTRKAHERMNEKKPPLAERKREREKERVS